ncbi:Patatin-like protein 6 [Cardamine amara subsp. amara]|uniref:Patatin n=1 Tax=Cardamine amara subsp. amara TaxID=228776 RepID=A0ABD1AST6_CARAN
MQRVHNKPISSIGAVKHLIKQSNNNAGDGGVTAADMQEPSIETDKLSYEIFSILESKFLFGYDDPKLMESRSRDPSPEQEMSPAIVEAVNGVVPGSIKNQRGKICVLSIDSGGMRGIIPGKALAYLEHALKSKSGDPNARIADYFDVASGSGIGGIFTAMLFASSDGNRPIFKAEDTWRFLTKKGKNFYKSPPGILNRVIKTGSGSGSKLEKAMKESFAELTLKDTLKPVLIPCYDLTSSAPFLFSRADALETDGYDFKLWEVCKATWAEPGVFEPVEMRSVDGQLVDVKYDCDRVMKWKAKHWARPAVRISADGAADTVDQAVSMAFGQCRRSNYVRIQANGSSFGPCKPNIDTDASPSNVNMLVGVAEEMLKQKNSESVLFGGKKINEESNYEKLDWLAGELVLEHQRRSCRIAPTVAFKRSGDRRTDQQTIFKDIDCMF